MTGAAAPLPVGILLGLMGGLGALVVLDVWTRPRPVAVRRRARLGSRTLAASAGAALSAGTLGLVVTGLPVVAILAAALGAAAPPWWRRRRERREQYRRLSAWPDAVDDLRSEVRAGVALPDAVAALARSGPEPLRPRFATYLAEFRATGSFASSVTALGGPADPVADRVIAALTVARELGGTELGTVLATLSTLVREDARAREEILARQTWTVSAARLAVAAPWLTLAVMCTRPGTIDAYRGPAGAALLVGVALISVIAYRLMARVGRLPAEAGGRA